MTQILYITVQQEHYQAKYESQIEAWRTLGHKCEYIDIKDHTNIVNLRTAIQQADLIYIRQEAALIKKWWFIKKLLQHKKYIIEIPTPLHIYFNEIKATSNYSQIKTNLLIMIAKIIIKNILKKSQLIIEFAEEHEKLMNKYKQRIFLWQNGLNNIELYKLNTNYFENQYTTVRQFKEAKIFSLIMVANLANYHGADRIIQGIYNYKKSSDKYKIIFNIISPENNETLRMNKLIEKLGLQEDIMIRNKVNIEGLQYEYQEANIAIGPIGSYRKALTTASSLKVRESIFFGLPTIIDHCDYDVNNQDFILEVSSSDEPINIQDLIEFYCKMLKKNYTPTSLSQYAQNNLTWNKKISYLYADLAKRNIIT